jgi:hypothetical protein
MPSPIPVRQYTIALWHLDSTGSQTVDYGSAMTDRPDFAPCSISPSGSPLNLASTPWGDFLDFSPVSPAFVRLFTTWQFPYSTEGATVFSSSSYTVEAIMRPGDVADEQTFVQFGEDVPIGVDTVAANSRHSLGIDLTTNRVVYRARDPWAVDTIAPLAPPGGVTFAADTFYYIAVTHSWTSVTLYVDGVAGETAAIAGRSHGTRGFTIGAMYPNETPGPVYGNEPLLTPFKGTMAGLHLYGMGGLNLSPSDITDSWTAIQAALPPPITPAQAVIAIST